MPFGSITFANPAVWYAASAAAVPIILHLALRMRARRVVLPTMRFVLASQQASRARQKLRHLLLLAMRIAAVLLIVALLAGMQQVRGGAAGDAAGPTALAVIIDNSASMSYQEQGRSHLAWGKALARQALENLPDGSQAAVLAAGAAGPRAGLLVDRGLVGRMIDEVGQSYAHLRLAPLLAEALATLADSPLPRKAVLLISDRTAAGWAGMEAADLAASAEVPIHLPDCWQAPPANVALGEVRLAQRICPVGSAVELTVPVSAVGVSGPVMVELRQRGQPQALDQRGITLTGSTGAAAVEFTLTPRQPGPLEGSLHLAAGDALDIDNARYFCLEAVPVRTMLVVRGAGQGARDTAFVMANAVAPAGSTLGRLVEPRTIEAAALDDQALHEAALVMLVGGPLLSPDQWQRLGRYVAGGGRLWLVPGDGLAPDDYSSAAALALLPVRPGAVEELSGPMGFMPPPVAGASEYLSPFDDAANPPLSEVQHARRVRVEAAPGAALLAFADGAAAMAERRVGAGRVLWWGFSPARSWSNLASGRLAQLPILARRCAWVLLLDRPAPPEGRPGQPIRLASPEGPLESVAVRDALGIEQPAGIDPGDGSVRFEPARPGHWRIELAGRSGRRTELLCVNVEPAESDLQLLEAGELARRLSPHPVLAGPRAGDVAHPAGAGPRRVPLDWPLALAAAALLIAESSLANRFYRQAAATA